MKRDFDLIRELLLMIEEQGGMMMKVGVNGEEAVYQLSLLYEAGFIVGDPFVGGIIAHRLTWQGHDLLDTIRDETVWRKTKTKIGSAVGTASLEVVKAVADGITRGLLGLG